MFGVGEDAGPSGQSGFTADPARGVPLSHRFLIGGRALWRRSQGQPRLPERGGWGGLSSQQGPSAPRCLRAGPAAPLGCGSALQPPAPPRCRQGNWAGGRSGRRRQAAYPRLPPSTQSSPSLRPPPLLQLLPLQPVPRLPPEETHRPDPRRCIPPPRRPLPGPRDPCTVQLSLLFLSSPFARRETNRR